MIKVVNLVKKILENETKKAEMKNKTNIANKNANNNNNKGNPYFFEEKDGETGTEKLPQFNQSKTNFFSTGIDQGKSIKEKLETPNPDYQQSEERYSNEFIRNEIEKANRSNKYLEGGNLFSDKFYDFDEVSPNKNLMKEAEEKW